MFGKWARSQSGPKWYLEEAYVTAPGGRSAQGETKESVQEKSQQHLFRSQQNTAEHDYKSQLNATHPFWTPEVM